MTTEAVAVTPQDRNLFQTRLAYKPHEYPEAYAYFTAQAQSHWLPEEYPLEGDVDDWRSGVLTSSEKYLIQHILKLFTQVEVVIEDYWSRMVAKWFKKPEIQMMANTFAAMEAIHIDSYEKLTASLGMEDHSAFLTEPTARAKIDRMIAPKGKSRAEIALSLAVFSAFNEGVALFSSFAILQHFSRAPRNALKGVAQIIAASIRDESLHSTAGCWLFRTLVAENPDVLTPELKARIVEAAELTVRLEDDFLRQAFSFGPIEGLTFDDMQVFVRSRTNAKLGDLGLAPIYLDLDKAALKRMSWFDKLNGDRLDDFFAKRPTDYAKNAIDWSSVFVDVSTEGKYA